MAISKVVYKSSPSASPVTWMDTTDKTVTDSSMLSGVTALKNDGTTATGDIVSRTSSDLTASGATVTAPAGHYATPASKSVANGWIGMPDSASGSSASVTAGTNTLTLSKELSITPVVLQAGYVSGVGAGDVEVSLTASVNTKAADTIHPSTSDQTLSASQYLTGAQTIKGVLVTNLLASIIKKDEVVKVGDDTDDDCVIAVTGTYTGGTTESWDYEWDYSQGLLSANGWSIGTSGTASESLIDSGVKLQSASSEYVYARNQAEFNNAVGVMEVVLSANDFRSGNYVNLRVCLSNGTNGVQIAYNNGYFMAYDNSTFSSCTKLIVAKSKTDYTIRIELNNGSGNIYINGTPVAENVSASSFPYSGNTSIWSQNQNNYITVKSVKIKKNRLT